MSYKLFWAGLTAPSHSAMWQRHHDKWPTSIFLAACQILVRSDYICVFFFSFFNLLFFSFPPSFLFLFYLFFSFPPSFLLFFLRLIFSSFFLFFLSSSFFSSTSSFFLLLFFLLLLFFSSFFFSSFLLPSSLFLLLLLFFSSFSSSSFSPPFLFFSLKRLHCFHSLCFMFFVWGSNNGEIRLEFWLYFTKFSVFQIRDWWSKKLLFVIFLLLLFF